MTSVHRCTYSDPFGLRGTRWWVLFPEPRAANSDHQMRAAKVGQLGATIATKLSFVKSDLLASDEAILKEAQKLNPAFSNYIEKLLIQKPYQLHPEAEKALAAFGASFSAPYRSEDAVRPTARPTRARSLETM